LTDVLSRFLGIKRTLLILDNCEHLIDACARLAEHLLNTCHDLKILCTSRESLGLTGETVRHVPTLSLPDRKTVSLADLLMKYEGIRLFVERALAVNPDFTLTDQNALAVGQICQRLDGIPLALELAAARVRIMPVGQIASRLDDRFHLLTAKNRTSPARHQTLHAAIDWSYDLLSEDERRLFYRLSVFSGGWTLDAAESVCSGEGIETNDVLNLLARLVDKSLVIIADGQRYGMLETIKQYAAEKLAQSHESDCVYGRYLDYYLKLAGIGDEKIRGQEQMEWLILLKAEQDNFASAMEMALSSPETIEKGCELVCALCWSWKIAGDFNIIKHWLELALSRNINLGESPARAKLLFNISLFSTGGIDWLKPLQAQSAIEQSLEIWHELGPDFTVQSTKSLLILGWIQKRYFDNDKGYDYINQAATFFEEKGDMWWQAFALNYLGAGLVDDSKDIPLTRKVLEKEATLWEKTGDQCTSTVVLWDLSGLACERKDFLEALTYLEKALQILRRLGAKSLILQTLVHLGDIARAMKQYELAEFYYKESMPLVQTTLYFLWFPRINQGLGYVMLGKGNFQQAEKYFYDALNTSRELNVRHGQVHFIAGHAALEVLRARLNFATRLFGAFYAQPESLQSDVKTDQKILFLVDQLEIEGYLDRCRNEMEKTAFEKAWNEGSTLSLDEVVDEILKERNWV
jgi:non-specific serine/threonine protein kinase